MARYFRENLYRGMAIASDGCQQRRRIILYRVATEAAGPLGPEQPVLAHSSDADRGGKLHFNRLQRRHCTHAACVSVHGMAHTALEKA